MPSPKYLIGESYGTIRSAGLAQELQNRHGIELNGIVLISSLLTYQTIAPSPQNDVAYASHLETYTATAWYHKKLPADLAGDLEKAVDASREFAFGEYLTALAKGNALTAAERKAVGAEDGAADRAVRGLHRTRQPAHRSGPLPQRAAPRQRLVVGRLDSRFTRPRATPPAKPTNSISSNTALQGPTRRFSATT